MNDALSRFREAGKNGLTWIEAVDLVDASLHDETDPDAYDAAGIAYDDGQRDRARAAVEDAIAGLAPCDPFIGWGKNEVIEPTWLRAGPGAAIADVEVTVHDAELLIEAAAQAAPLEPDDILAIVRDYCPLPPNAGRLAEMALNDFQAIPRQRAERAPVEPAAEEVTSAHLAADQSETRKTVEVAPAPGFSLDREPGLLGNLARWSVSYAFRPVPEFAPLSALAILAPVFGRRFVTPTNAGLNLYMIALAQTGTGKEALIGAPVAALCAAKLDFLIGAGDFTSDSAIELALRMRPNFVAPIDEIGEFIGAAQHRNAAPHARTIRKALLDLYAKSRPDARWTGKQKVEVDSDKASEPVYAPHLSLLGCSTLTGFFDALTEANLSDGLINRFIVVRGGRPGAHNLAASRSAVPTDLAKALADAYALSTAGNLEPSKARESSSRPHMRVVPWGDGGEAAWTECLTWQIMAEDDGRAGIVSRAAENSLKVATIRALARDGAQAAVTAEDVAFGWHLVRASIDVVEAGARENMAGSEFEQLVKAMERAVIEAGPNGIAWSKLLEKRGIAKHTKSMVEGARERLEARGVIFTPAIGTGPNGGRPGLRISARQFGA